MKVEADAATVKTENESDGSSLSTGCDRERETVEED